MRKAALTTATLIWAAAAGASPRPAYVPRQVLANPEPGAWELLGRAVATGGDVIAVGAPGDDPGGIEDAGAVYLFVPDGAGGWTQAQRLVASDAAPFAEFGDSVATDGATIAVGSLFRQAVYVFVRQPSGAWQQQGRLSVPVGSGGTGHPLALSGDTLVVGSEFDSLSRGAVHVYTRSAGVWSLRATLAPADLSQDDRFGEAVALSGTTLAVGAPGAAGQGAVYVFEGAGASWSAAPRFAADPPRAGQRFGESVAVRSDTLAAGAPDELHGASPAAGAVYVFERSGTSWSQTARLITGWFDSNHRLGRSLALLGEERVVAGAPGPGEWNNSVHVFMRNDLGTWVESQRIGASPSVPWNAGYGGSLAATATRLVVGAAGFDATPDPTFNSGAAYVLDAVSAKGDADADGRADLYLRAPDGRHEVWLMDGATLRNSLTVFPGLPPGKVLAGVDDFDGDLFDDLLVWDPGAGGVELWLMHVGSRLGEPVPVAPPGQPPANWQPVATADFNSDGFPDILWRNGDSQKLVIWTLRGRTRLGSIVPTPGQAADANWEVVGARDLDANGHTDLLWYNPDSGRVVVWWMDAAVHRISGQFTNPPAAGDGNWRVVASADLGPGPGGVAGSDDLLWRNRDAGRLVVWYMDHAGNRTAGAFLDPAAPAPDPEGWAVVGPR